MKSFYEINMDNNIYYGSLPKFFMNLVFCLYIFSMACIWPSYYAFLVYPIENYLNDKYSEIKFK